jgi:predicted GIY-YIG superfamily endonuclease
MERKPNGYWTYERCKECASKYTCVSDLQRFCSSVYNVIYKNKWYELVDHFERRGNRYKRLIYVYEFSDNTFYVGLTGNLKRRSKQHSVDINSSVYKHMIEVNIEPILLLKSEYIDVDEAIILEEYYLNKYIKNGWKSINKVKTGGLGSSNIKWTKIKCIEEGTKYTKISEYQSKSKSSYNAALKNGWIDEVCKHMKRCKSKNGEYNNKFLCREVAKVCKNRSDFLKHNWAAYNYSIINGWMDEFFPKYSYVNK